jgi:hypothetical protein
MTSNEATPPIPQEVVFTPILFRATEKKYRSSRSSPAEETLSTGTPASQYSMYNFESLITSQRKSNDGSPKKSRSPSGKECVIVNTRRTSSAGDGGILHSDAPPDTVALPHLNSIMRKAIILDLDFQMASRIVTYMGQAGIVKDTTTVVARVYTALHNVTDITSKSTTFFNASLPTEDGYLLRLTDENFNLDNAKKLKLSQYVHWL